MSLEQLSPTTLTAISGVLGGGLFGMFSLAVGRLKRRVTLGAAGLIVSATSGAILGLLIAVPVAALFVLVMLVLGEPEPACFREDDARRTEDLSETLTAAGHGSWVRPRDRRIVTGLNEAIPRPSRLEANKRAADTHRASPIDSRLAATPILSASYRPPLERRGGVW